MKTLTILTCCHPDNYESAKKHLEYNANKVSFLNPEIKLVSNIRSKQEFNDFFIKGFSKNFNTDYVLNLELDAMIMNPYAFDESFFDYDYIGAPITKRVINTENKDLRVGNSGFSLRSKQFCDYTANNFRNYSRATDHNCDIFLCVDQRKTLIDAGFKFATYKIAERFSVENNQYTGQFGAHKSFYLNTNRIILRP